MKTKNIMHTNLIENYIAVLNDVVFTINGSLKQVTDAPSINIGKYYLSEANMLRISNVNKPGDNILYLAKIYDMKKHLNFLNKLSMDLLKDIIAYSNKYKIDEMQFFEKINPIISTAKENYDAINESLSRQDIEASEKSFDELVVDTKIIVDIYNNALNQTKNKININEYNFNLFFKNNLYKNIKKTTTHINKTIVNELYMFMKKANIN